MVELETKIMSNQYTESFDHIVKEKFSKSAKTLLMEYAKEKVTYEKAAKITGFTTCTIRKWCTRYDIRLLTQSDGKKKKPVDDFRLLANKDIFQAKAINIENALSRRWSSCVNQFI